MQLLIERLDQIALPKRQILKKKTKRMPTNYQRKYSEDAKNTMVIMRYGRLNDHSKIPVTYYKIAKYYNCYPGVVYGIIKKFNRQGNHED